MKELKDYNRKPIEEGLYYCVNSPTNICFMSLDPIGLIIERPRGNRECYFFDTFASETTGDYLPILDTDIERIVENSDKLAIKFIESKLEKTASALSKPKCTKVALKQN